jgi:ABC-2 type transport system ATP-binding protein
VLFSPFAREHQEVLRGVDLQVEDGTRTGLLGPNGAGKTTLLRILASTITPDRGEIEILGLRPDRDLLRIRSQVGFVLGDERSFFWRLTGERNLLFFAALYSLDGRRARRRISELSEMLEIQGEVNKPFRDLSTGMRHRLALARALLHDPKVLLVDEPTRGLDPGAARRIRSMLAEIGRTHRKTMLLATHSIEEASGICDRVAFLKDGVIVAEGETAETLSRADEVFGGETQ